MMTFDSFRRAAPALIGLALLAACSAPPAVAPERTAPVVSGKLTRGVIAAARPVAWSPNQNAIQNSVDGVLSALGQPLPQPAPVNATEFVIHRSDDSAVSMVTRGPNAGSGGGFATGAPVEIVDGAQPALLPGN